jgi:hypothetical protein
MKLELLTLVVFTLIILSLGIDAYLTYLENSL